VSAGFECLLLKYQLHHVAEDDRFVGRQIGESGGAGEFGDIHGHITGPAFGGVEGGDPYRMFVVAREQIADQCLAIGPFDVGLAPAAPKTTKIDDVMSGGGAF
jgi:hypothetical protein